MPSCLLLKLYQSTSFRVGRMLICRSLVLGVSVGEAEEVVLVQVHDDQLVCGSQVHWHLGEFLVKVTSVSTVPLQVWRVMAEGGTEEQRSEKDGMNQMGKEEKTPVKQKCWEENWFPFNRKLLFTTVKSIRATKR